MAADKGRFIGLIAESEQFVGAITCLACRVCACWLGTLGFDLEAYFILLGRCSDYEHAWIICGRVDDPPSFLFRQFLEYDSVTFICPGASSNWYTIYVPNCDREPFLTCGL